MNVRVPSSLIALDTLVLVTMNMCSELGKYAFPDPCSLEFFFVFVGYYHLSKYSTLFSSLYNMKNNILLNYFFVKETMIFNTNII